VVCFGRNGRFGMKTVVAPGTKESDVHSLQVTTWDTGTLVVWVVHYLLH
jgi:hypothetical protein